jgi:hypothetical protein
MGGSGGLAEAFGVGTAATAMPRPAIIIALRRSIVGIANTVRANRRSTENGLGTGHVATAALDALAGKTAVSRR